MFTVVRRFFGRQDKAASGGTRRLDAFTLIEMLVVLGMLGILMGTAFNGVGRARTRARIAKANAEVREIVNAILSFEQAQIAGDSGMNDILSTTPVDATANNLQDLLGEGGGPVYLNAPIVNGAFRDPWGTPYRFRVVPESVSSQDGLKETVTATVTFPNRQRGIRW